MLILDSSSMQCFMRVPKRRPAIGGEHDKELALRWKEKLNASNPFERAPRKGGNMSKRLPGRWEYTTIGCINKNSSWHLIGFPDGTSSGSTVVYCSLTLIVMQVHQTRGKRHDEPGYNLPWCFFTLGVRSDGCQHYNMII